MATSALLNAPPQATKSKESAPEVLSYRQRLYDRETLMLPNEPWNPAAFFRPGATGRTARPDPRTKAVRPGLAATFTCSAWSLGRGGPMSV